MDWIDALDAEIHCNKSKFVFKTLRVENLFGGYSPSDHGFLSFYKEHLLIFPSCPASVTSFRRNPLVCHLSSKRSLCVILVPGATPVAKSTYWLILPYNYWNFSQEFYCQPPDGVEKFVVYRDVSLRGLGYLLIPRDKAIVYVPWQLKTASGTTPLMNWSLGLGIRP